MKSNLGRRAEMNVDPVVCGTNPDSFNTNEVLDWLRSEVRLPQFEVEFLSYDVDGATMGEISKLDLEDLGVKNLVQRARVVGKWKQTRKEYNSIIT